MLVPTHLWKVVYSPKRQRAGAYLITNDATRTYRAVSVSELSRLVGIDVLPGVPQRVRDTLMTLPDPQAGGSRDARGAPASEPGRPACANSRAARSSRW